MCLDSLDNILHLIIVVTKCLRKVAQMVDGKQVAKCSSKQVENY